MHTVALGVDVPGCTQPFCHAKCLEFESRVHGVFKRCTCETKDHCDCFFLPKQHLPSTIKVMELAAADNDKGTFI
jgi:hypothetical protein